MITLYRTPDCPRCSRIQEALEKMALAHKVVIISDREDLPDDLKSTKALPALIDGGELIEGAEPILAHLEKLDSFREEWYRFQSDACFCDREGEVQ